MNKILLIIILTLSTFTLTGCYKKMTNQQIVEEIKYCEENGLGTREMLSPWNLDTVEIVCEKQR